MIGEQNSDQTLQRERGSQACEEGSRTERKTGSTVEKLDRKARINVGYGRGRVGGGRGASVL